MFFLSAYVLSISMSHCNFTHFFRDVNSVDHDNLRIDVWDFNPEENVSEKFKKFGDIKDSRGLRKFIKETLHASAGKTTYDLLGSVEIPLKVKIFNDNIAYVCFIF